MIRCNNCGSDMSVVIGELPYTSGTPCNRNTTIGHQCTCGYAIDNNGLVKKGGFGISIKPFTYDNKEIDKFILKLKILKLEAVALKLMVTAKKLDEAEQKVGWEFADIIERQRK